MVVMESNVGKLEEAALKRKEKLLALKKRKRNAETNDQNGSNGPDPDQLPEMKVLFRNYQPTTEKLEETTIPQVEPDKVEDLIKDQLENSVSANKIADVEMSNLAPRKITYDLRRGVQERLDKLDRRTDRAIGELIRDRLKNGIQQDFSMSVTIGARAQQKDGFESDED